jgi:hypothetical protein
MQEIREESLQFKWMHWLLNDTLRWINQRELVSRVFVSNQFHFVRIQLVSFVWKVFELRPCPSDGQSKIWRRSRILSSAQLSSTQLNSDRIGSVVFIGRSIVSIAVKPDPQPFAFVWLRKTAYIPPVSKILAIQISFPIGKCYESFSANFESLSDRTLRLRKWIPMLNFLPSPSHSKFFFHNNNRLSFGRTHRHLWTVDIWTAQSSENLREWASFNLDTSHSLKHFLQTCTKLCWMTWKHCAQRWLRVIY